MRNFILITALLLCSLSWISVSVSDSQIVEVQPGENVTLLCSNIYTYQTRREWFRVVNKTKAGCISSLYWSNSNAKFCDGFQNGKFSMTSNISTLSLQITQVDLSDSGLYLCGFYREGHTILKAIHLNVQGHDELSDDVDNEHKKESDGITKLTSVILGCLTVFLVMIIIGLVVKIKKLQTAPNEEQNTPQRENLGSDDLNYAALSFNPKPKRNRRPAPGREVEPNVVYAATR